MICAPVGYPTRGCLSMNLYNFHCVQIVGGIELHGYSIGNLLLSLAPVIDK